MKRERQANRPELHRPSEAQSGFTLIEIMVSVAILSIMAGLMVPMVYKVWESNEKTETRQKMAELKKAMVGDQRLVQNGIRMHYGFVGDNGDLPLVIDDLVNNSGSFVNWKGPYLVGAFDPNDYYKDAWGRNLVYTRHNPAIVVNGQTIVATLASVGPDGQAGTSDDLDENTDPQLQILESEVWPTDKVEGRLSYVFTAPTTNTSANNNAFSAKVYVEHNDATGVAYVESLACFPLLANGELAAGNTSDPKQPIFSMNLVSSPLPVGRVVVASHLYANGACVEPYTAASNNEAAVYVSDGLSTLAVNLPTVHYTVVVP